MDLGSGIAIAGVCIALTSAILKFVPSKNKFYNNPSNPGSGKEIEVVHKRIKERQTVVMCDEKHKNLDEKITAVQKTCLNTDENVLEILKKINL